MKTTLVTLMITLMAGSTCLGDIVTTNLQNYLAVSKNYQSGFALSTTTNGNTYGLVENIIDNTSSAGAYPAAAQAITVGVKGFDGNWAIIDDGVPNDEGVKIEGPASMFGSVDKGVVGPQPTSIYPSFSTSTFDDNDGSGDMSFTNGRGLEQNTTEVNTLVSEFTTARTALLNLEGMTADQTINNSSAIGSTTITLSKAGYNLIDFSTGGSDVSFSDGSMVIEAPVGATPGDRKAVFFLPSNLILSNYNILVGANMGLNDVLFVSSQSDNGTHFSFGNVNVNGVSFWDIHRTPSDNSDPSTFTWNGVAGCTQLLGDTINLSSEQHLSNCAFNGTVTAVPEPSAFLYFSLIGLIAGYRRWRHRAE